MIFYNSNSLTNHSCPVIRAYPMSLIWKLPMGNLKILVHKRQLENKGKGKNEYLNQNVFDSLFVRKKKGSQESL